MDGNGARLVAVLACAAALVCAGGAPAAPPAAAGSGVLSGEAPAAGFAQALGVRPFEFPRDHGPHPEFRQEWWYFTGNLEAAGGERFGFELTFFRFALAPPTAAGAAAATAATATSAWRAREIYMAHFAVTDVARGRFRFAQKLSRAALGLAGAQAEPLAVWIDDWALRTAASGTPRWTLNAHEPGYAIELSLEPLATPVLNGTAGLSRKAAEPTAASYYYSIPRLRVRGRLFRDARALEVEGLAWLDREWGSGGLGAAELGWDWFGLQLSDGSALMFYALRDRDGRRDPYSAGTWVVSSGEARPLANAEVAIAVTRYWRNAAGVRYPAAWSIRVPALTLELSVHPVLTDQELTTAPPYWEGAVDVSGEHAGRAVGGRGYVELVGYGAER
jgi:predicted secreted hydrolase